MISQIFRAVGQNVAQKFRQSSIIRQYNNYSRYGTFTTQDFIHDNSHGETGSLITRFVKYLAIESSKYDPLTPQTIKYAEYYPIHDTKNFADILRKTPTDQLSRLIVFTYTYKTNGEPYKFVQAINDIDRTCVERLPQMTFDSIVRTLYAFMFLMPNKVKKTKFYSVAIEELVRRFESNATKEYFTQTCFYLGMGKRNQQTTQMMKEFLQSHLSTFLGELSADDLAIVSNAAFKTSVVIANKAFQDKLVQEALKTPDGSLLITFVKSLRLNRVKSAEVNEKIKQIATTDARDKYDFKEMTHFFAYFAEAKCNDKEVCEAFIQKGLNMLDELGPNGKAFNDMRQKDIATFLWCCANLSTHENLTEDDLKMIVDIVIGKINREEFRYCPDDLVDICLSLWMLGCKSEAIATEVFKLNLNPNPNAHNSQRIKLDSRIRLLMSAIEIESPELVPRRKASKDKAFVEARSAPAYAMKSEELTKVFAFLQKSGAELGLKSSSVVSQIHELNIPGILVKLHDDRAVYVEVLDKSQYLQFGDQPVAIAALKIRLLRHLGYDVIVLNSNEVQSEETLAGILAEKLAFSAVRTKPDAEKVAV